MRRHVVSVALACGGLAIVPVACLDLGKLDSSSDDAGASDASLSDVSTPDSGLGLTILEAKPPARPAGSATPSGQGKMRWFAARRLFSGSVDPTTGKTDPDAWKRIGHDVDGECTTLEQSISGTSGVCSKPPNADDESQLDGDDCRDNAYGQLVGRVVKKLDSSWESNSSTEIANGGPTLLLRLSDLDDGPDDPFVPGAIFLSARRKSAPKWDGSDRFELQQDSLVDGTLNGVPLVNFPKGYLVNDQWVSSELGTSPGPFPMFVFSKVVNVQLLSRTLVVALDPPHRRVIGTVFSGVVSRSTIFVDLWAFLMELFSCDVATVQGLADLYVTPAADVGDQPPGFSTPGVECSGMSVGAAFQWVPILAPEQVLPSASTPAPCDAAPPGG